MKRTFLCLFLVALAGCKLINKPLPVVEPSSREAVTITITKNNEYYNTQLRWVRYNPAKGQPESIEDMFDLPVIPSLPDRWGGIKMFGEPPNHSVTTNNLLQGELLKVPDGSCTAFGIFITPQAEKVSAKGLFFIAKKGKHFEFPFEGLFELGEPTIICEQDHLLEGNGLPEPEPKDK